MLRLVSDHEKYLTERLDYLISCGVNPNLIARLEGYKRLSRLGKVVINAWTPPVGGLRSVEASNNVRDTDRLELTFGHRMTRIQNTLNKINRLTADLHEANQADKE